MEAAYINESEMKKHERALLALKLGGKPAVAELCRRSFSFFLKQFWNLVTADTLQWNWHMEYLCTQLQELAERVGRREPKHHDLIINIPPGTSKSTICSIMFPAWCWTRWPWMRFITASYSGALSLEHAEYCRDIVRHPRYRELFGLVVKQDKDTKSNFRIVRIGAEGEQEMGGGRYSTSVGGTLTGFHAHILIVDDPIDPNRAASEKELKNANYWMDQTLSTRKIDKKVTPLVLIMQRLHQNDPAGHMLSKQKSTVKHVCLPGEIRNYKGEVRPIELIRYYRDGLLDPVRMGWEVLKEMEADLGQYGYASQIGQRPTPPGGGMFKVDMIQVVDTLPQAHDIMQVVRYWDKAGTEGDGAFTVGVKMARLHGGKFLVMDVKRGQWSSDERERIIRATAEADGIGTTIYVEQEPGSGGKESAENTVRNLAGFRVHLDRPTGDKVHRADPWSVQVNNGNVMLLRARWNHQYIEEHRYFPFGTYKDQVDASAGAFNKLVRQKVARVV